MLEEISERQALDLPDVVLAGRLVQADAAHREAQQLLADALEAELQAWNAELGPHREGIVRARLAEVTSLGARGLLHRAQATLQTLVAEWQRRRSGRAALRHALRDGGVDAAIAARTFAVVFPPDRDPALDEVDEPDALPAGDDDGQQAPERGPVPAGRCCWAHVRSGGMYHEGTCTRGMRQAAARAAAADEAPAGGLERPLLDTRGGPRS